MTFLIEWRRKTIAALVVLACLIPVPVAAGPIFAAHDGRDAIQFFGGAWFPADTHRPWAIPDRALYGLIYISPFPAPASISWTCSIPTRATMPPVTATCLRLL